MPKFHPCYLRGRRQRLWPVSREARPKQYSTHRRAVDVPETWRDWTACLASPIVCIEQHRFWLPNNSSADIIRPRSFWSLPVETRHRNRNRCVRCMCHEIPSRFRVAADHHIADRRTSVGGQRSLTVVDEGRLIALV